MSELLAWALQALILTFGIYFFLRFVRSTRGSRLIRGLVLAVIVGVLGLWSLVQWLELEELNYILQSVAGYVVVIFAILFHPELRRGIAQLGEHQLVGRLRLKLQEEVLEEVSKAVVAMAARRQGALIAFERESPLSVYIEGGVPLDSVVTRLGLESLFHHGSALHDGAVIIRKDRVAAASCLFPLTRNPRYTRLRGTRHRAALGLSEETDAVTVVASEETGGISICSGGEIRESVPPGQLRDVLRSALGAGSLSEPAGGGRALAWLSALRQDAPWIAASLLIGVGILYVAHRDMSVTELREVRLVQGAQGEAGPVRGGELVVALPPNVRLESQYRGMTLAIAVTGTRGRLRDMGALGGRVAFESGEPGVRLLPMDAIDWNEDSLGVRYEWKEGRSPQIALEGYQTRDVRLSPDAVEVEEAELDPRYQLRRSEVAFDPEEITVAGPTRALEQLASGELALRLEPIRLSRRDVSDKVATLQIHESLRALGLSIADGGTVQVRLPIVPATRDLGVITKEIAVVCMSPELSAELALWSLPPHSQEARFTILTSGLLPATSDPGSTTATERIKAIRRFVDENLVVFVDLAELPPPGEGRAVPVRWTWRKDWRKSLESLGLDMGTLGGREVLDVRLESEPRLLLEEA